MTDKLCVAGSVTCHTDTKTFTVDGDPFPWFITEDGPRATRFRDDLYAVHVTVIAQDSFACTGIQASPVINGIMFPWYLTEDGYTFKTRRGDIPTVELSFFTKDYCGPGVEDSRSVWAHNGDKVAVQR
jgi:hypothetical protein